MTSFSKSLTEFTVKGALSNKSLSATSLIAISAFILVRYIRSPWRKVPPGPRGLPLIGSALKLVDRQWLIFTKWQKTYGDIIFLTALGQPVLVLNSHKAAADLLDRRSAIYSDRPRNIVGGEILCGGLFLPTIGYNDSWRHMRKAAYESLHKGIVGSYHNIQATEALYLARDTLANPIHWEKHIRRTTTSVSMSVVYDTPSIESEEDKSVSLVNNMMTRVACASAPGAHFVEFLPFLMAIPSRFAKWKREAEEWYAHDSVILERLFEDVRARVANGDERPSFSATLIKDASRHGLSLRENAWLAATMYGTGAESTAAVMSWWMLAMVLYPDVQKRAQAELDRVVGRDRLPSFADLEHLPYIRAMGKESLRWRPIAPIGFPHRLSQDDWYEGHFIPKGTLVVANVWYLNRNPEIYGEDAEHFNPERHLGTTNHVLGTADTKEDNHVTYGYGRRHCVGRYIANNSLFIDMAMMLWSMNIERHLDANGKPTPIDVDGDIDSGLVIKPVAFKCKITPRFPEVKTILEQETELLGA
jgi:cytochrome P450